VSYTEAVNEINTCERNLTDPFEKYVFCEGDFLDKVNNNVRSVRIVPVGMNLLDLRYEPLAGGRGSFVLMYAI
jgi:hypothetical protein